MFIFDEIDLNKAYEVLLETSHTNVFVKHLIAHDRLEGLVLVVLQVGLAGVI